MVDILYHKIEEFVESFSTFLIKLSEYLAERIGRIKDMARWKRVRSFRARTRGLAYERFGTAKGQLYLRFAKLAFFGAIGFLVFLLLAIPYFAFNLPTPDKVVRKEGFSTKIVDRNGKALYDIFVDEK